MELQHIVASKRAIILALILWCLVLGLGMAYLFSQRSDVLPNAPVVKNAVMKAADNAAAKYRGLALHQNMLATVAVVFDSKNTLLAYTPDIAKSEDEKGVIEEKSSFSTPYAHYTYTLNSTEDTTPGTYITDSLQLEFDSKDVNILYIDNNADGVLDTVFLNDETVIDPQFFAAAQDQYIAELALSRNYLLGLTTK